MVVFEFEVESCFYLIHVGTKSQNFWVWVDDVCNHQDKVRVAVSCICGLDGCFNFSLAFQNFRNINCIDLSHTNVISVQFKSLGIDVDQFFCWFACQVSTSLEHCKTVFFQVDTSQFSQFWRNHFIRWVCCWRFQKKGIWNQTWKHQTCQFFWHCYTVFFKHAIHDWRCWSNWFQTHVKWASSFKVSHTVVIHHTVNFYFSDIWNRLLEFIVVRQDDLLCTFCFSWCDNAWCFHTKIVQYESCFFIWSSKSHCFCIQTICFFCKISKSYRWADSIWVRILVTKNKNFWHISTSLFHL